jgi:hypothetical protein
MAKPSRLPLRGRIDIPVRETSGLALRRHAGQTQVLAVGDRDTTLAVGVLDPHADDDVAGLRDWQRHDLADLDGWESVPGGSQFEALACDGVGTIVLMREDPAEVVVVDAPRGRVVARLRLVVPAWSALAGTWDDPSSRGEGLLLLRDGRLLVAKEKKPRALVEFGPPGTSPRGVAPGTLLAADEAWPVPDGVNRLHALAVWPLKDTAKATLGDISSLTVHERDLYLLSDRSEVLARVSLTATLARGGAPLRSLDGVRRLPKGIDKPEAVVVLDERRALVALDTPDGRENGLVVGLDGPWQDEHA